MVLIPNDDQSILSRRGYTAVLSNNKNIIYIFGGIRLFNKHTNDFYALNIDVRIIIIVIFYILLDF